MKRACPQGEVQSRHAMPRVAEYGPSKPFRWGQDLPWLAETDATVVRAVCADIGLGASPRRQRQGQQGNRRREAAPADQPHPIRDLDVAVPRLCAVVRWAVAAMAWQASETERRRAAGAAADETGGTGSEGSAAVERGSGGGRSGGDARRGGGKGEQAEWAQLDDEDEDMIANACGILNALTSMAAEGGGAGLGGGLGRHHHQMNGDDVLDWLVGLEAAMLECVEVAGEALAQMQPHKPHAGASCSGDSEDGGGLAPSWSWSWSWSVEISAECMQILGGCLLGEDVGVSGGRVAVY